MRFIVHNLLTLTLAEVEALLGHGKVLGHLAIALVHLLGAEDVGRQMNIGSDFVDQAVDRIRGQWPGSLDLLADPGLDLRCAAMGSSVRATCNSMASFSTKNQKPICAGTFADAVALPSASAAMVAGAITISVLRNRNQTHG